jgi:hypothetical protein
MKDVSKIILGIVASLIVISVLGLSAKALVSPTFLSTNNYGNNGAQVSQTQNTLSGNTQINTQTSPLVQGNVQEVSLKVVGSSYVLNPSVLKKGVPVRMTADINNMPGCSKGFRIPDFSVTKSIRPGDTVVEFTPDKTGTFTIACFMNMYRGTFSVTDDGSAPTGEAAKQATQVQATVAKPSGGGCTMGAGGGGCGCGG